MDLELRQLLHIARRRWWILVLAMLVAGGSAYVNSSRQTPIYSATATMIVSQGVSNQGTADYSTLLASQQIATTYQQLIDTQPVRDRVAAALGREDLGTAELSTSLITDSLLIQVTVEDEDPDLAAQMANTFVTEFQGYIADQTSSRSEATRSGIDSQIKQLQDRQREIDQRIKDIQGQSDANSNENQRQINELQNERDLNTQTIADLQTSALNAEMQTNAATAQIQMADPAQVPTSPISPRVMRTAMLGVLVGLLLGIGVVALLEYLDNTIKPESDIQAVAGAPILASISDLNRLGAGSRQVYTVSQPRSSAAEAMRLLRANLEFTSATDPIGVLTVTSSTAGEGKSTTVANLGVVLAQAGKSVLIVDTDLRKPVQHTIFGVANDRGLTTWLTHPDDLESSAIYRVALPGLSLLPSGPIPPNPADLVSSERFIAFLKEARAKFDIVILDSPPLLQASDALIIGSKSDGITLVCRSNQTRVDAFRHAAHSIRQANIRLVGVVLNRTRGTAGYYGEYYGGYSSAPATAESRA